MDPEALIQKYLHAEISPEELTELEAHLAENPEAAEQLFTMADEELLLGEAFQALAAKPGSRRLKRRKSKRSQSMPWRVLVGIAACIALTFGAVMFMGEDPLPAGPAVATLVSPGDAVLIERGGKSIHAQQGMVLTLGDIVSSEVKRMDLVFNDGGTKVNLAEGSRLRIGDQGRSGHMYLYSGIADADVVKRPSDDPFILQTPHAEAIIKGTRLSLAVEDAHSHLEVYEGLVGFERTSDKASIDVPVNFYADAGAGMELIAKSLDGDPPIVEAGGDLSLQLPGSIQLAGKVTDDGFPRKPGRVELKWSKNTGPGEVSFSNAINSGSRASFSMPGTYLLKLTAFDGKHTTEDMVKVTAAWPDEIKISFGPAGTTVPEGFIGDDGLVFDAKRMYGWNRKIDTRYREGEPNPLQRRHISPGSAAAADTWEIMLGNGTFEITVCCGDTTSGLQGPHRVVVEGVTIVDDIVTGKPNPNHVTATKTVTIRDGRLTMLAGAVGTNLTGHDGTTDTNICYIIIKRK